MSSHAEKDCQLLRTLRAYHKATSINSSLYSRLCIKPCMHQTITEAPIGNPNYYLRIRGLPVQRRNHECSEDVLVIEKLNAQYISTLISSGLAPSLLHTCYKKAHAAESVLSIYDFLMFLSMSSSLYLWSNVIACFLSVCLSVCLLDHIVFRLSAQSLFSTCVSCNRDYPL
jgi:hypothetical protein